MESLYNIIIRSAEKVLPLSSFFSEKIKLFVNGRKNVFSTLEENFPSESRTIWIHAASLGEYEQAVPIIEELRKDFPDCRILVTFFSPSGYENKKHSKLVDLVTYLPLDTERNVKRFLDLVDPDWVLFVKYEFWPNFLKELKKRNIKTLLISGSFRKEQIFFKPHGKWMQTYLQSFQHFFLQNERSEALLNSIGFKNTTVSGDTRFDRVSRQIEQDNFLPFIGRFKDQKICVVMGSTWAEDEDLFLGFINGSIGVKFIIAPHQIKENHIYQLQQKVKKKYLLYSEMEGKDLSTYDVFIIDTIGLLTKIYSYADIAYVGGAAGKTGLHNILEPATFGIPVIIGKNYSKFPEAKELRKLAGLFSVATKEEFETIVGKLISDKEFRKKTGMICEHYVQSNLGSTPQIMEYIHKNS